MEMTGRPPSSPLQSSPSMHTSVLGNRSFSASQLQFSASNFSSSGLLSNGVLAGVSGAPLGSTPRRVAQREGYVELLPRNEEIQSTRWKQRTRQLTVDFTHESPFTASRQLEDKRCESEFYRNPHALTRTKAEKTRSEIVGTRRTTTSRPVAVKAHLVSKIVRDATGQVDYTLIPPPLRMVGDEQDDDLYGEFTLQKQRKARKEALIQQNLLREKLSAETNPAMSAYAQESVQNPVMRSFGHRPKSASRTFHPSTMKLRLKRGELLPSLPTKTGVGLPVNVLATVLGAPSIMPHRMSGDSPEFMDGSSGMEETVDDVYDDQEIEKEHGVTDSQAEIRNLFLDSEEMSEWKKSSPRRKSDQQIRMKKSKNKSVFVYDGGKTPGSERPGWDESFSHTTKRNVEKFAERQSVMNSKADCDITERLRRFQIRAVGHETHPFCDIRQDLDRRELAGEVIEVPKSKPVKGRPLYYDPLDRQVQVINQLHAYDMTKLEEKHRKQAFQQRLKSVKPVKYFPTTTLKNQLSTATNSTFDENPSSISPSSKTSSFSPKRSPSRDMLSTIEKDFPGWEYTEMISREAMKAAQKGDIHVLYTTHINPNGLSVTSDHLEN